jgi:hypothetical protein
MGRAELGDILMIGGLSWAACAENRFVIILQYFWTVRVHFLIACVRQGRIMAFQAQSHLRRGIVPFVAIASSGHGQLEAGALADTQATEISSTRVDVHNGYRDSPESLIPFASYHMDHTSH